MQTTIALVGIGGYGAHYMPALLNAAPEKEIRLVAGIDPYARQSPWFGELEQKHIPIFPDLESFYRNESADLVIISAPIQLHAPLTCLALSKGAQVLCEKPLAGSIQDAQAMLAAEKQSGKQVAIGYQWSFSRAILALKRDILAGRFGRPLLWKTLALWSRRRSYFQRNRWAGRIRAEDGAWVLDSPVHNATAHYLHNMLFLQGSTLESSARPRSLSAELYRANPIENYDAAALSITTSSESELLFLTAHPVQEHTGPFIEYVCEDAVIQYPGPEGEFLARFQDGTVASYGNPNVDEMNKLWQSIEALRTGCPVVCGIQAALPQLTCALAAQSLPIHDFPADLIQIEALGEDHLVYVTGLADAWRAAYESGQLPGVTQAAPWAMAGERIRIEE